MTQHTHRGTCPVCGAVQAVNNNSGLLANHGYTLTYGWQNGTCIGSNQSPAEVDSEFGQRVANSQREHAAKLEAMTLADVAAVNVTVYENYKRVTKVASSEEQYNELLGRHARFTPWEEARVMQLQSLHAEAAQRRQHAAWIEELAAKRLGQPLFAVADEPKVEKVQKWFKRSQKEALRAYEAELKAAGYKVRSVLDRHHGPGITVYGTR